MSHGRRAEDDRYPRRKRRWRPECPALPPRCAGSARATSASRVPCRAARCPLPRPQRNRAPTGDAETRVSRPSRRPSAAMGRWRRADRQRRAPPRMRRDSTAAHPMASATRRRHVAQTAPACHRPVEALLGSWGHEPTRRAPGHRQSAARASFARRARRAARLSRLPAGSSGTDRRRPRAAGKAPIRP